MALKQAVFVYKPQQCLHHKLQLVDLVDNKDNNSNNSIMEVAHLIDLHKIKFKVHLQLLEVMEPASKVLFTFPAHNTLASLQTPKIKQQQVTHKH